MVRLLHLMRAYGRVSADGLHQSPLPPGDTSSRLPYGCRLFQYITFALARRQPGRTNMHTNNAISLIQMALLYLLVLSVVGTFLFFFLFCVNFEFAGWKCVCRFARCVHQDVQYFIIRSNAIKRFVN